MIVLRKSSHVISGTGGIKIPLLKKWPSVTGMVGSEGGGVYSNSSTWKAEADGLQPI